MTEKSKAKLKVLDLERVWMNMQELMKYLNIGRDAIDSMVARGEVHAFKPGKFIMFDKKEIDDWVRSSCINVQEVNLRQMRR